jgi:hypothetical protein
MGEKRNNKKVKVKSERKRLEDASADGKIGS